MVDGKQVSRRDQRAAALPLVQPGEEAERLAEALLANAEPDAHGGVILKCLPTAVERQILSRRADALRLELEPIGGGSTERPGGADWVKARQAISAVFAGRAARKAIDVQETLDTYLGWLADLPAFAIVQACMDIGRGKARLFDPSTGKMEYLSPTYDLSATVFHMLASAFAEKQWAKVGSIDKVLRVTKQLPPEPSAEEKKRIGAEFEKLRLRTRGMAQRLDAEAEGLRKAVEDQRISDAAVRSKKLAAAAWRAEGYEPIENADGTISSPKFLQSLHRWPPHGAKQIDEEAR